MADFDSPWNLGQLTRFLNSERLSWDEPIVPEPEGLTVVVARIFEPVVGQVVPTWTIVLDQDSSVALCKKALREIEATLPLDKQLAVWGSSHMVTVVTFADHLAPLIIVMGRDEHAPTWPNCLSTAGGYPDSITEVLLPHEVALREGSQECVATIPHPTGSGEQVALNWSGRPDQDFGFEARKRVGLNHLELWTPQFESLDRSGHTVRSFYDGEEIQSTTGLLPVFDPVHRRYDCVSLRRMHLPCRLKECQLRLAEYRPDGGLIDRPIGWYSLFSDRVVTAWEGGHSSERLSSYTQMTPTLQFAAWRLKHYFASLLAANT